MHKIRAVQKVPDICFNLVGDILNNLRAALDHAVYDVAAAVCIKPKNAYFPFSRDAANFENNMKGRCADVPKEIYALFRSYEPYKGGSEALWALNEARVANEHIPLVLVGSAAFSAGIDVTAMGFAEMPYTPTWNSAKNEMELFTTGPQTAEFKGHFQFGCYIAFGEISCIEGKPAIPILDQFAAMVETIVGEIEAEARRLKIIT